MDSAGHQGPKERPRVGSGPVGAVGGLLPLSRTISSGLTNRYTYKLEASWSVLECWCGYKISMSTVVERLGVFWTGMSKWHGKSNWLQHRLDQ